MTSENEDIQRALRTEARRMAVIVRHIEVMTPGCFGEAANVIRQLAAGDAVAPDDLIAALASMRLTVQDNPALLEATMPPKPKCP